MVLVGVSLGSAIAVQFALQHPEAVAGLVLSSPQVYVDGIGPMSSMPRVLSYLGVQVDQVPPTAWGTLPCCNGSFIKCHCGVTTFNASSTSRKNGSRMGARHNCCCIAGAEECSAAEHG